MSFNSIEFLIFFIVISISYYSILPKFQWVLLLAASCIFYLFFKAIFILIIAAIIIVAYYSAIKIEEHRNEKSGKTFLIIGIAVIAAVLLFFKYYNFLDKNISGVMTLLGMDCPFPYLNILLPVGLSFHTLQLVSYMIEVYKGNFKAERQFGILSLYVMFYPQLCAGPIERPQNVLGQLREEHQFSYELFKSGINLMIWGFVKKILIADRLYLYVNSVYSDCRSFESFQLAVATVFFAIQIYCDFSGYSDIAIGAARSLGINLTANFNRPYFATNIREFWERWHITLSSWCRDYLYIPMGGNRVPYIRQVLNVSLVFLISGLWHGPSWLFIIWGGLHAFYFIVYILLERSKVLHFKFNYMTRLVSVFFVFILVTYAWIFFRAESLHDAFYISNRLFHGNWSLAAYKPVENFGPVTTILPVIFTLYIWFVEQRTKNREAGSFQSIRMEMIVAIINITLILVLGSFSGQPFIYFQF